MSAISDWPSALNVSGSGAGPYNFSGFAEPTSEVAQIQLAAGAIQDAAGNRFVGDQWTYQRVGLALFVNQLRDLLLGLNMTPLVPTDANGDGQSDIADILALLAN